VFQSRWAGNQEQIAQDGHHTVTTFCERWSVHRSYNQVKAHIEDALLARCELADQSIDILLRHMHLWVCESSLTQTALLRGTILIFAAHELMEHCRIVLGMKMKDHFDNLVMQQEWSQPSSHDFPWKARHGNTAGILILQTDGVSSDFNRGRREQVGKVEQIWRRQRTISQELCDLLALLGRRRRQRC
jgi:hypothetical protein